MSDKDQAKAAEAAEKKTKASRKKADEKVLTGWLKGRQGIDVARFMQVYQSFGTNAQVTRATKMTRDYGIEGTPTIVVAGKYATMAAAPERLLQVVDELIVKARKEGLAK